MTSSGGLRQCVRDVSPYLLLLVIISTFGPLQFGFHLVSSQIPPSGPSLTIRELQLQL